jgi:putative transposase
MTNQSIIRRTYQFQLRPTKRQIRLLESALAVSCEVYNAALQERREAWKRCRKSVTAFDQTKELTEIRAIRMDVAELPVDMVREPIRRVDRAFQAFFRRCKAGQKPGFPRFRLRDRYDSLAMSSPTFKVEGGTIIVSKMGGFRMRMHREMRGTPKHCTIKRSGKRWRVSITCECGPVPERKPVSSAIGIDLGLTHFLTFSDGQIIDAPKWVKESEAEIARRNRELATKKRGSRNRRKAKEQLRRAHERVANRRLNFCHHLSKRLMENFDLVAFEKLNISSMINGKFDKNILSVAWGILLWQLTYKAANAGKWAVPVNPRGTTKRCSGCETEVPKALWDRVHRCPRCGLVIDRDHNAAINILSEGLRLGRSRAEPLLQRVPSTQF